MTSPHDVILPMSVVIAAVGTQFVRDDIQNTIRLADQNWFKLITLFSIFYIPMRDIKKAFEATMGSVILFMLVQVLSKTNYPNHNEVIDHCQLCMQSSNI